MYIGTGLAAITPASALRQGYRVIPVPVKVRELRPGSPALFIVRARGRGVAGLGADCPEGFVMYEPTGTCTQTPGFRLEKDLNDYLIAAQQGQYGNISPDQLQAMLTQEVNNMCRQTFIPCTGAEQSQAQQVAATFAANPQLAAAAPPPSSYPVVYTQQPATAVPTGSGLAPSARVSNLSRPGQSFQVGDTYLVQVTGPANAPVSVSGTQGGKSLGTTPMGQTDGAGNFQKSGIMDGSTVGAWSEQWTVGNTNAGTVNFSVAAAPSSPPPAGAGSGAGAGGGSKATPPPPPPPDKTGGVSLTDFFSSTFGIGGYEIPVWALGLAAVGGVWLMSRGK